MKGIIVAGGKGTRLGELSKVTNKCLLPVGKWPMIYWPLRKLTEAGIKEILIVSGSEKTGDFIELLGSGNKQNCDLTYKVQDEPLGIAHAVNLGKNFSNNQSVIVMLGDNIFGDSLVPFVDACRKNPDFSRVFLKKVKDPSRFGVPTIKDGKIVHITEKPTIPDTNFAVTGIYHFPPDVFSVIESLKPSNRGEYEITDVNNRYLEKNRLDWMEMHDFWIDAGTYESLLEANKLVNERC